MPSAPPPEERLDAAVHKLRNTVASTDIIRTLLVRMPDQTSKIADALHVAGDGLQDVGQELKDVAGQILDGDAKPGDDATG